MSGVNPRHLDWNTEAGFFRWGGSGLIPPRFKYLLGSQTIVYKIKYKSSNNLNYHRFGVGRQIFANFSMSKNRIKNKYLETVYDIKNQQSEHTFM